MKIQPETEKPINDSWLEHKFYEAAVTPLLPNISSQLVQQKNYFDSWEFMTFCWCCIVLCLLWVFVKKISWDLTRSFAHLQDRMKFKNIKAIHFIIGTIFWWHNNNFFFVTSSSLFSLFFVFLVILCLGTKKILTKQMKNERDENDYVIIKFLFEWC